MEHLHTFSMRLVMKYLDRILQYYFRIRPVIDFANVSSLYFSPSAIRASVPSLSPVAASPSLPPSRVSPCRVSPGRVSSSLVWPLHMPPSVVPRSV